MSGAIDLNFIGTTLRAIQADQRSLRMENELMRGHIARLEARMVTREELAEVVRVLAERIGNFEALMEARFDQQEARFERLEARFDQQEARFERLEVRFDHLSTQLARGGRGAS